MNTTDQPPVDPWPRDVPTHLDPAYAAVELTCAALSAAGNSLVLYVYARHRSLRTVKNAYVASLAVADLLVGLVGVPSALLTSVGLPRQFEACLVMNSLLLLLCTGSIMSLVAVTVDRLWAIVRPFSYTVTMTQCRGRVAIGLGWAAAGVVGLLPLMGWNRGRPPVARCFFTEVVDGRYLVFVFVGTIAGPSVLMGVVYALIYKSVIDQGETMRQFHGSDDVRARQTQLSVESRAAQSIAVIVLVFVVSWLPLYALNTLSVLCPGCRIPKLAFTSTIVLSHFNSVWNPLLYAWGMRDIREALKRALTVGGEREKLLSRPSEK